MTDFTEPTTIDVDVVIGEINNAFQMRAHTWTDRLSWPNVTVKALADEIERLRDLNLRGDETMEDRLGFHATAVAPGHNVTVMGSGAMCQECDWVYRPGCGHNASKNIYLAALKHEERNRV